MKQNGGALAHRQQHTVRNQLARVTCTATCPAETLLSETHLQLAMSIAGSQIMQDVWRAQMKSSWIARSGQVSFDESNLK